MFRSRRIFPRLTALVLGALLGVWAPISSAQNDNRLRAIALVKEAANAFSRGDFAQTIRVCQQAIRTDPSYPRAHVWLGAAHQKRGEKESACEAFVRVTKIAPNTPDSRRAARGIRELNCNGSASPAPLPRTELEARWSAQSGVGSLAWTGDSEFLTVGALDGSWRLVWAENGEIEKLHRGEGGEGTSVANGRDFYALGNSLGQIMLFDTRQGRRKERLNARSGQVTTLSWSRDSRFLAAAGADGQLKILFGRDLSPVEEISRGSRAAYGAAWSADNQFLAAGFGAQIEVFNTKNWKSVRTLRGDASPIGFVDWSRDGALIAGTSGSRIRIWNARTGAYARGINIGNLAVSSLAFGRSPLLAVGGFDGKIRLFNAANGRQITVLNHHQSPVRGLHFDVSGTRLASGDQNGNVAIWRIR